MRTIHTRMIISLLVLFNLLPSGKLHCDIHAYFQEGNRSYDEGDYEGAIEFYEKARSEGEVSAALLYNLAGAYFKSNDIGRAVLNYERAHMLDPRDPDINTNHRFARSTVVGRIPKQGGFLSWGAVSGYSHFFTVNELTVITSLLFFMIFLVFAFTIVNRRYTKKAVVVAVIFSSLVVMNAIVIYSKIKHMDSFAVTVVPAADVLYGPFDTATKYFTLHQGNGVNITETMDPWYRIRRSDGKTG